MGSLGSNQYQLNGDGKPSVVLDPEEFRRQGYMAVDFIADYYKNIEKYPVRSQVEPGYLRKHLPETAPLDPEPVEAILDDVRAHIVPGLTHWMSPNYFAYFGSSGSTAGFLGETLAAGFNVVGFNWASSPAATELESLVMDWLGAALGLPKTFLFSGQLGGQRERSESAPMIGGGGGVLQGTTCEAILCVLVAARDKALRDQKTLEKLSVYCSDQTHCSFKKAAQIAGINMQNFRVIKTSRKSWFAMRPEDLREAVAADVAAGLHPIFVLATVGTTSTAAVDPLPGLCHVAKDHDMWVHVDAAYAGSACLCPEFRHFIDGVEEALSFSFNAHKWLFTQQDCCCLWVKDSAALIQSLSTDPEYLRNKATESKLVVDYKDWQVALSRRFRSLKLWMVLRSYGLHGIRAALRQHVELAKGFEEMVIGSDGMFEVFVPRYFSAVCFRLTPAAVGPERDVNLANQRLLDEVNETGEIFMTHSVVEGVYLLRFVVGSTLTTDESYVVSAWNIILSHAKAILVASS